MSAAVIDLFAGPGGWDLALAELGPDALGVELDPNACATRAAAGLRTLHADVGDLDPRAVLREHFATATLDGLIASPPCQAFSMAGKGAGRRAIDAYLDAIHRWSEGKSFSRDDLDDQCDDPRAHLVLEPLRWATTLRPTWVALEQVPPVLPIWQATARALQARGYHVWTGVLSAERYGVPQTRERAILLAHRDRPVGQPPATHQRYIAPRRRDEATDSLFDAPDPQRIVRLEEGHLQPWVSMAEALGWPDGLPLDDHRGAGMIERHGERPDRTTSQPAPTVTAGGSRRGGGPRWTLRAGAQTNATERAADEPAPTITAGHDHDERTWRLRAAYGDEGYDKANPRAADEPAGTVTTKHGSAAWVVDTGNTKGGARPDGLARRVDEPASTITSRADQLERRGDRYDSRGQRDTRTGQPVFARQRSVDEPAPTIATQSRNDAWVHDRPVTTVAGDPRVHPPGHKVNGDDVAAGRDGYDGRAGTNAVRVTLQEALVLQSFPPDYPVHGSKSRQFEQVGNAFPPLMALRVLETVVDAEEARAA